MENKSGFFKTHGDAITIISVIAGLNIAIGAIMISMWISHASRIDTLYNTIINLIQK